MVYFGSREFQKTRPGLSTGDRVRFLLPFVLFGGVISVVLSVATHRDEPASGRIPTGAEDLALPLAPGSDGAERRGVSEPGEFISPIIDVEPLQRDLEDMDEFVRNDKLLDHVKDHSDEGEAVKGLMYLLHRWRAGTEVSLREEFPSWPDRNDMQDLERFWDEIQQLRGARFRLYLSVQREPLSKELRANPSGVRRYWELWGTDYAPHLHRVLFYERDVQLPYGTPIVVEADFLRLYEYVDMKGDRNRVPEWVARSIRVDEAQPIETGWGTILWPLSIGLLGLALLVTVQLWPKSSKSYEERRRKAREGGMSREPSPAE